jgi:hypothetical protein
MEWPTRESGNTASVLACNLRPPRYCTIVFVISLRFVHNYLFEIHFFQRHRKNRMINKCAEDVVMSTVVCEKKLFQCCLSDLFNA